MKKAIAASMMLIGLYSPAIGGSLEDLINKIDTYHQETVIPEINQYTTKQIAKIKSLIENDQPYAASEAIGEFRNEIDDSEYTEKIHRYEQEIKRKVEEIEIYSEQLDRFSNSLDSSGTEELIDRHTDLDVLTVVLKNRNFNGATNLYSEAKEISAQYQSKLSALANAKSTSLIDAYNHIVDNREDYNLSFTKKKITEIKQDAIFLKQSPLGRYLE